MPQRYLLSSEAKFALHRGKAVECFIGAIQRDGFEGIRWLSIRVSEDHGAFVLHRYDSADCGSLEYLDVYEFRPLDPELQMDEPDETEVFSDFDSLLQALDVRFPGCSAKLVNEGVIQDEYAAFKTGHRNA
jgi:hypothetical protein